MRTVKVCVYDEEEQYAKQLSAFLNRQGEGRFQVTAITSMDCFWEYVENRSFDILLSANPELLCQMKQQQNIQVLWLKEEEKVSVFDREIAGEAAISRYAGARKISQRVEQAAARIYQTAGQAVPVVGIYSPVGRCGKTQFALEVACNPECRWLYIGMEDYGLMEHSLENEGMEQAGDAFLFFIKERNKEKFIRIIEECQGIVPSAFSPFDIKILDKKDWEWIIRTLRGYAGVSGVLVDIGTGVLQDFSWLSLFDYILVPYLQEESAIRKKEKFENLLEAYQMVEIQEKLQFMDMGNEEEIREKKQEMGYR